MWKSTIIEELVSKRNQGEAAGGVSKVESQHLKGKMTARERINTLFDTGTFTEINMLGINRNNHADSNHQAYYGDGVITGYGYIQGRLAFASAQDFTIIGGTLGEIHSRKICRIMDLALENKAPYISINDSGGARIEEGVVSLNGYSEIFFRNTKASGIIPQISVVMGPCAGGACYSPAITDFVFMTRNTANMFITGPSVVKEVIGETVSAEELGGADVHSKQSGVAHFAFDNDEICLKKVRELLRYLPQNRDEMPPVIPGVEIDGSELLQDLVPDDLRKGYNIKKVIETFADVGSFLEISEHFAKNIVIGLCRIDGYAVGIVANNPAGGNAGSLDIDSSEKAARFVRFCDCFNIPILALVDVPGFMPGVSQEHGGIIRRGAKLLYAFSEATVPKVTLILRKAYGGAYIAMNSKGMGADLVYAWPIAQTAVMGAEGAVAIIHRKELALSNNQVLYKKELVQDYEKQYMNPYIAAERGYIDEVIIPEETRKKIAEAFRMLRNKERENRRFHGNIPL